MRLLLVLLIPSICLGDPPKPDLSKVTDEDIIATVQHLQRLVHDAEEKLTVAREDNAALGAQTTVLVRHLGDARVANEALARKDAAQMSRIATLEADLSIQKEKAAHQARLAWKWRLISLGIVLLVGAFFVARQYFPFLKIL